MRSNRVRLPLVVVLLAWLAQLWLPVLHAAIMAAPPAVLHGWCGDPSRARDAVAGLPAEIREALLPDGAGADHLSSCAKLCAAGSAPPSTAVAAADTLLRTASAERAAIAHPAPHLRDQAPRPPAQAPPLQA